MLQLPILLLMGKGAAGGVLSVKYEKRFPSRLDEGEKKGERGEDIII